MIDKIRKLEQRNMSTNKSHIVPNRLKELRERYHHTQEAVAAKLGVTEKTYRLYEKGNPVPSDKLLILSHLYSTTMDDLFNFPIKENGKKASKFAEEVYKMIESLPPNLQYIAYERNRNWVDGVKIPDEQRSSFGS